MPCFHVWTRLSPPLRACVWPARGACVLPPLPPAKGRRLGLTAGSSECRVVPGLPTLQLQPPLTRTPHAGRAPKPRTRFCTAAWDSALSHSACGTQRPGKVSRGRLAARAWDFHSRARPPPQRVAMETAGSWCGKQTRRKAKYYECSWGDFRGAGGRRA